MGNVIWQPQQGSQQLFLSCPIFEVLLEGNRGGGKTDVLLMDYLRYVGVGYGQAWRGLLLRETYKNLEDVKSKAQKWIPRIFPDAKFNGSENYWTFKDGERLYFSYARIAKDYDTYHGWECPWVAWEELTNWSDLALYIKFMSICRSSHPEVPRHYRSTCNPWGKGHNQVKKRFRIGEIKSCEVITEEHKVEETGKTIARERCYIHSSRDENKILLNSDPEYIINLKNQIDPNLQKAWIDGSWDITSGGMFDDLWNRKIHILPVFDIPETWYIDRSFDYGTSRPFSIGWWAQADGTPVDIEYSINVYGKNKTLKVQKTFPKKTLVRIWEYYGCDSKEDNKGLRLSSNEIGEIIKKQEEIIFKKFPKISKINAGVADSSIFDNDHNNESIAQNINLGYGNTKSDDIFIRADKSPGSRIKRWQLIRDRLKNSLEFPLESPGIFILEHCHDFIRTFPVLSRDEKNLDDVDTSMEDHIADETGYRVLHDPITVKNIKYRIG